MHTVVVFCCLCIISFKLSMFYLTLFNHTLHDCCNVAGAIVGIMIVPVPVINLGE